MIGTLLRLISSQNWTFFSREELRCQTAHLNFFKALKTWSNLKSLKKMQLAHSSEIRGLRSTKCSKATYLYTYIRKPTYLPF